MFTRITGKIAAAAVAATAALLAQPAFAAADVIHVENGRFLQTKGPVHPAAYVYVAPSNTYIENWTVGGSGVDILGHQFASTPTNARAIDLNGGYGPGTISTELDVKPGRLVTVHFMATSASTSSVPACGPGGVEARFTVKADDAREARFNAGYPDGQADWQEYTYTFRADRPDVTLTFSSVYGGNVCGAWITDVWAGYGVPWQP